MKSRLALLSLVISILSSPIGAHASWTVDGVPLSIASGFQGAPKIAPDGSAGAIVTWQDSRSGNNDIYVQRVNASGVVQWTMDGMALGSGVGDQQGAAIVSDGFGGAIVAWQDSRSGNFDIYVQRINASGAVLWTANGVAVCTAAGDQSGATISSDGSGGAIVTWSDLRSGNLDIYSQRINASGAAQWTADGVALRTGAGDQRIFASVADGSGGAIVTWQDSGGADNDIYAQRINAGVVQWTANGVAVCTAAGSQANPRITSDGSGGAIVTWEDSRGADIDIYAQRISTAGVVQWTINGVALCTAAADQSGPTISSDGSGGAIVTWSDSRSGTADIYTQRINAPGVVQWTANGVAVCTAASVQALPTICSDGSGGAIITWYDLRAGGPPDIYAQRVNSAGAIQWTLDGVALCTAVFGQIVPTIASDESGGAIVTWQDVRSGSNFDIYAQRIGAAGLIPTSVGDTPSFAGVSLSANSPNPFTNETTMDLNLAVGANVNVTVYDVAGREVRRIGRSYMGAGLHQMNFDGHDDKGRALVGGVYFYKVTANGKTITRKMVIAR